MSEPTSSPDPTPAVPPAPSFTYGMPAATPAVTPPPAAQPLPAYGEQIPGYVPPGSVQPAYGSPAVVKPRRTWDLVLTIILLVLGLGGVLAGVVFAFAFNDPAFADAFNQGLAQQGIDGGAIDFSTFGNVIVITHLALYLIALVLGVLLLVRRKVAFYVPLAAGVIATAIFWGGYFITVFSAVDISNVR